MSQIRYRRILLKLSGEALAGGQHRGLDFDTIGRVCDAVGQCVAQGVQVGIVVGGGNFWRGLKDGSGRMERTRADHMGMLATTINALAVADCLEQRGIAVRVQTAIEMKSIAEPYIRGKAIAHLERGRVVIFGCGTGNPYFSTDTGAVLRGVEIGADAILLAKKCGRRLFCRSGAGSRRHSVRKPDLRSGFGAASPSHGYHGHDPGHGQSHAYRCL